MYKKLKYVIDTDCSSHGVVEQSERNPNREPFSVDVDNNLYFEYVCNMPSGLRNMNMEVGSVSIDEIQINE